MLEEQDESEVKKASLVKRISFTADDEAPDEGEAWLISYADMMTLVACFFILMMAFANFDQPTFKRVARQVEKHFKGANLQVEPDENTELAAKIQSISQLTEQLEVQVHPDGLEVKFNSGFLFDSGESQLKLGAVELLQLVTEIISVKKSRYFVEVHGHTDSTPLSKTRRYIDNWDLSAARAASVVRELVFMGFSPKVLNAIGHADSVPEAPERDENGQQIPANMAKNRRVILFIRDLYESEKVGLGLTFEKNKK
jgi:chemotaxis protein MotB